MRLSTGPAHKIIFLILFLATSLVQAHSARLSWNIVPNAAGYRIYRTTNPNTPFEPIHSTLILSNSFADISVEAVNTYFYQVRAVSSQGLEGPFSEKVSVRISGQVSPLSDLPSLSLGPEFPRVEKGALVRLNGQAFGANPDSYTLFWEQLEGPPLENLKAMGTSLSFSAPRLAEDTVLSFRLSAADNQGNLTSKEAVVMVAGDQPPQIEPVTAQTVEPGARVKLSASGSDQDGDSLTYRWEQVSGPRVELDGSDTSIISFTAPYESNLRFRVLVSDGLNVSQMQTQVKVSNQILIPASIPMRHPFFDQTFVGLALANPNGNYKNSAYLLAADENGNTSALPQRISLEPNGQSARTSSGLTGLAENARFLIAKGDHGPIQGFFMVGDNTASRLDGVGGKIQESRLLHFPFVRRTSAEETLLLVFNPDPELETSLHLQLFSEEAVPFGETELRLPALGSFVGTLDQLFGATLNLADGFLRAQSDLPVVGLEFSATASEFSSLQAQIPSEVDTLVAPHFFISDQVAADTELRLLNLAAENVRLKLEVFRDGFSLINETEIKVPAFGLLVTGLKELLEPGITGAESLTGFLRLTVAGDAAQPAGKARVAGLITFSGNQGNFQSTLPLLAEARRETTFLQVAQSPQNRLSTGLAILNLNEVSTEVTVRIFNSEGKIKGETTFTLDAGKRVVNLLDEERFFGKDFNQMGGHFLVSSTLPIYSFALFFDNDLRFMSSIEGQNPIP